jgi:hypothetical protein
MILKQAGRVLVRNDSVLYFGRLYSSGPFADS